MNHSIHHVDDLRMKYQLVEWKQRSALVENTHDDFFAELCRNGRHAKIDGSIVDLDRDAAVLRHSAFGDIETRKDLQSRYQRQLNLL